MAGAGKAAPTPSLTWNVAATPIQISFSAHGVPLASESQLSGGPGGRLSYRVADGSFHTLTNLVATQALSDGAQYQVATDEPGRTATVTLARIAGGVTVSLAFTPSAGITDTFESFAATDAEHYLGGGEESHPLDLRGRTVVDEVSGRCFRGMSAPFYLSSAGYGISLETAAIASMAFPGASPAGACFGGPEPRCPMAGGLQVVQICAETAALTYDVFAGTPEQIVSAYTARVGRPLLPPPSQFALIKWRDVVGGPADLFEDVDKLHALAIPIGWVLLDNPWETADCYGTMTFDSKFPDPAGMIRAIHARGVQFMLWISPLVRGQSCPPSSLYPQSALLGTGGKATTIDLTDPGVLATFESSLRALIALGVDGFKGDRGNDVDFESQQLAGGSGLMVQNAYPLLYAKAAAAAIDAAGKTGAFATIFHVGSPGSSATLPGFWAGDQSGTFAGLQDAIHDGLSAGIAGYPIWGSDTGGYGSDALTPEVFVRWAQFSAVSPVFEVGGIGANATFWNFGEPTISQFRAAAILHYELFPYLYSLAGTAHASGVPILRPLALEYPNDPVSWQQDLEVLVGHDLLAAPVTVAAPSASTVHVPAGSWIDLWTGGAEVGPSTFSETPPLDRFPLYLRSGAVIPFAARTPLVWPKAWPVNALALPGRAGWLYAPATGTSTNRTADFGSFRATMRGKTAHVVLRNAPAQVQVSLVGVTPASVRIGGAVVRRSASDAALRARPSGWERTASPFPGVVLKIATHGGSATVDLTLS